MRTLHGQPPLPCFGGSLVGDTFPPANPQVEGALRGLNHVVNHRFVQHLYEFEHLLVRPHKA